MRSLLVITSAALALAGAATAEAQTPTPEAGGLSGLFACTQISEDSARLACFDQAAATLRASDEVGEVRVIDLAAAKQIDQESFGFSLPSLNTILAPKKTAASLRETRIDRITATIQSVRISPSGAAVITLENGQVWRQIDLERPYALKVGASVQIAKAALGSFLLTVKSSGRYRVRREQ